MSTIQSTSEHGSSEGTAGQSAALSRDPSGQVEEEEAEAEEEGSVDANGGGRTESQQGYIAMAPAPGTVPMTRSNSLPVLTLRELQALKQKDGELGIARGGEWAWVSREMADEGSAEDT